MAPGCCGSTSSLTSPAARRLAASPGLPRRAADAICHGVDCVPGGLVGQGDSLGARGDADCACDYLKLSSAFQADSRHVVAV